MKTQKSRMLKTGLVGVVTLGLVLTGCASGGGSEADEQVTLRFAWAGGDVRSALTEEVIDLYESLNPNITIETESTGTWGNFWQKVSTQMAGGDAPDIMQFNADGLADYGSRGALADLRELGVDTSEWAPGMEVAGDFDDTMYGATWANNAPVILANADLFEKVGVPLPDDETWTWDDLADLAIELQTKSGGEFYGVENFAGASDPLRVWIRQQGGNLTTPSGPGFEPDDVTPWFEYWKDLQERGGTPQPTVTIEDQTTAGDQALIATNKLAMGWEWTNLLGSLQTQSGANMVVLRAPSQTGDPTDSGMWIHPSMFLVGSAATEHPEEVADFINFLTNNEEAGLILGTDRGVPVNMKVREALAPQLDEVGATTVEFLDALASDVEEPDPITLVKGEKPNVILLRYSDQLLLGQLSPKDAAEGFHAELLGGF